MPVKTNEDLHPRHTFWVPKPYISVAYSTYPLRPPCLVFIQEAVVPSSIHFYKPEPYLCIFFPWLSTFVPTSCDHRARLGQISSFYSVIESCSFTSFIKFHIIDSLVWLLFKCHVSCALIPIPMERDKTPFWSPLYCWCLQGETSRLLNQWRNNTVHVSVTARPRLAPCARLSLHHEPLETRRSVYLS